MPRSYPRWSGGTRARRNTECQACGRKADKSVEIQWDWSRSEDEWYDVCIRHAEMAKRNTRRFAAHLATKDEFVSKREADNARG